MEEFLFILFKTIFYWIMGLAYIGVIMAGSWFWNQVFGDGAITLLEAFVSAAIVFVPIVVGKVMTSSDD